MTPIPLSIMEEPEATRKGILPLMGMVQASSNICALKFDYTSEEKPEPLPQDKAKAYLQAIVDKGKEVPKMYSEGTKLVSDDILL